MRLIDADALPKWTGYALSATEIAIEVEHAPTIDAVPVRHGEWIETEQPNGWTDVSCATCSVCGEDFVLGEMCMDDIRWGFKYCPNCGAKMDGERKDDATD